MSEAWGRAQWRALDVAARRRIGSAAGEERKRRAAARAARQVLRAFSGSFFLVTRFLPPAKRAAVETIYAAVRYPDEIVDTFALPAAEKVRTLDEWQFWYETGLGLRGIGSRLEAGVPWILAAFQDVMDRYAIPAEHYRSFLAAMRRDAEPRPFERLDQLIEEYVYGSAVVVGYFLAHVYGPGPGRGIADTLESAGELGIALQLTNFARDVAEDRGRGRLYLPLDMVRAQGEDAARALAAEAERRYSWAAENLDHYAEDTRAAIRACIRVYGALNRRILNGAHGLGTRQSVPTREKFQVLPASKYWRLPLAYLGAL